MIVVVIWREKKRDDVVLKAKAWPSVQRCQALQLSNIYNSLHRLAHKGDKGDLLEAVRQDSRLDHQYPHSVPHTKMQHATVVSCIWSPV